MPKRNDIQSILIVGAGSAGSVVAEAGDQRGAGEAGVLARIILHAIAGSSSAVYQQRHCSAFADSGTSKASTAASK